MARPETHIIHRQEYQLDFDGNADILGLAGKIDRMYKKILTERLDPLLSKLVPPGRILRINRLELDLGTIEALSLEDFEKEFARRLEGQVKELVDEMLKASSPATMNPVSGEEALLEGLAFFLERGRFPWWKASGASLSDWLGEIWETVPHARLEQALGKLLASGTVRRRMLFQFPRPWVLQMAGLRLPPSDLRWAEQQLVALGSREAAAEGWREQQVQQAIIHKGWEAFLEYVFASGAPAFSREKFSRILKREKEAAAKADIRLPFAGESAPGAGQEAPSPSRQLRADLDLITYFLLHGRLPGDMPPLSRENLEARFRSLLQQSPRAAEEVLHEILPHRFALDRLLFQFGPETVQLLIAHLAGTRGRFLEELVRRLELALPPRIEGRPSRMVLQAAVLASLGRRGGAGPIDLVREVLRTLVPLPEVELPALMVALEKSGKDGKQKEETALPAETAGTESSMAWQQVLREMEMAGEGFLKPGADDLLEIWMGFLQKGVMMAPAGMTPSAVLEALINEAPEKLRTAMEEVLASPRLLTRLSLQLPPELLLRFLGVMTPSLADRGGIWVRELASLAQQRGLGARAEAWAWRSLLAAVLGTGKPGIAWMWQGLQTLGATLATEPEALRDAMVAQLAAAPEPEARHMAAELNAWDASDAGPEPSPEVSPDLLAEAAPDEAEKKVAGPEGLEAPGSRQEWLAFLLNRGFLPEEAGLEPRALLEASLREAPEATRQQLRRYMSNPHVRSWVAEWLKEDGWEQVINWPDRERKKMAETLHQDLKFLLSRVEEAAITEEKKKVLRRLVDEAFLQALLEAPAATEEEILRRLLPLWVAEWGIPPDALLQQLRLLTEQVLHELKAPMRILLGRLAQKKQMQRLKEPGVLSRKKKKTEEPEGDLMEDATPIHNAGIIILAPFLPQYFKILGLRENQSYVSEHAASRAVHLLQYLASGKTATPEHELLLNKVLCGIPLEQPIEAGIEIQENEAAISEQLLNGVLQNWGTIKRSSVAALQETFLLREGFLLETEETWKLRVTEGPFDMVLDTLPWSISMIKLSWMEKVLQVEWR